MIKLDMSLISAIVHSEERKMLDTVMDEFRVLTADEIESVSGGDNQIYEIVVTADRYTPPPGCYVIQDDRGGGGVETTITFGGDSHTSSASIGDNLGITTNLQSSLTKSSATINVKYTLKPGDVICRNGSVHKALD